MCAVCLAQFVKKVASMTVRRRSGVLPACYRNVAQPVRKSLNYAACCRQGTVLCTERKRFVRRWDLGCIDFELWYILFRKRVKNGV